MLQIYTTCFILSNDVRDIDRDEHVSLLVHEADQCEHDGHELRLVGAALLFSAGRRGREEVVGWCIWAVGFVSVFKSTAM